MMSTDIQTLKSLDLFADLNFGELEKIASLMHMMKVTEGEVLTRKGEPARTFFIVLSGNFMLSFKKDRSFTLHNKGNIIGWSTVVTPFQYRGTAIALTDGLVLSMPGQEFLRLIQSDSTLGDKIMRKINKIVSERMPYTTGTWKD
ncbi:MAG: cyclic nucleotide-binding domain-containing protein [Proteobacteria bacterium]|nr:cyclic nucleotide-binding domain-containing protein [Desulfobacteraceae bacterium]MBU2521525.1 cyclic nucleotide-binding domain-containing protein [Pseudomonadota bacterium]MBU3981239.1 cyclic nucleotide-binding domain-containing protein [Pseudomonadota bacterium]MBU4011925.1 cyclic nucleotide-binding domain-containing protein [Pseudomonadota bacterium]MBU4067853.1 cyclic nucleotide-binding domain-containing protein [Pseudomonadota bacterium]